MLLLDKHPKPTIRKLIVNYVDLWEVWLSQLVRLAQEQHQPLQLLHHVVLRGVQLNSSCSPVWPDVALNRQATNK